MMNMLLLTMLILMKVMMMAVLPSDPSKVIDCQIRAGTTCGTSSHRVSVAC